MVRSITDDNPIVYLSRRRDAAQSRIRILMGEGHTAGTTHAHEKCRGCREVVRLIAEREGYSSSIRAVQEVFS
jgi:hypothetical protein